MHVKSILRLTVWKHTLGLGMGHLGKNLDVDAEALWTVCCRQSYWGVF